MITSTTASHRQHGFFILGWIVMTLLVSCASNHTQNEPESRALQNISIESAEIERVDPQAGEIVVRLKGVLPNPAYAIESIETRVGGEIIDLYPHVSHDPSKIVIQVTVPFERRVVISGLEKKTYRIRVGQKIMQRVNLAK